MGYVISAHIVRVKPADCRLSFLPPSVGSRLYFHRSARVCLIDAYRSSKPAAFPFQSMLPAADIPLELPAELSDLERVYAWLSKNKQANSFKMTYINFSILLSKALGQQVLSFISDDDEMDFTCIAAGGALERLRCRSADLEITFADGRVKIQPLQFESDDDADLLTNVGDLRAALPGILVADRNRPWTPDLHAIAREEIEAFTNYKGPFLGLGSFDPPEDEEQWELINS
jgi:hypothetical protein